MILCLGPTPATQRVMVFHRLQVDAVNRAATTLDAAAGKSVNVSKVLKTLGETPIATGFLGGPRGEFIRAELQAKDIAADFVTVTAPTRQCVTVLDEAAGTHTELVEGSRAVTLADYEALLAVVRRRCAGARAVVMSGSLVPGGSPDFYFRCAQLAQAAGALTIVDAQGAALREALKAWPGLVKPNRQELAATVGRELADEAAVLAAMRELHERGAQRVVVTAGQEPTLAFDGKNFWRIGAARIKAVNPIGSGDAFAAGLTWRLLRGDDLGEACRWASATGAANALTLLAGDVNRADAERLAQEISAQPI